MSTVSNRKKGFTLIEALAASVLVGVGITAVMGSLANLARLESRSQESERMQRLALDKYDEVVATGQATSSLSGDFGDRNEDRYDWNVDVQPSGVQDLNSVRVTVTKRTDPNTKQQIDGLLHVPAQTSGTATAGATP